MLFFFYLVSKTDAMGRHFPKAVLHLMLGIYCLEICMMGLFLMARDANGSAICIIHTMLMASLLALTAVFHHHTCRVFKQIVDFLPISLCESKNVGGPWKLDENQATNENNNNNLRNKTELEQIHEENESSHDRYHKHYSSKNNHATAVYNIHGDNNLKAGGNQVVHKRSMRSLSEIMSPAVHTTTGGLPQQRYSYWNGIEKTSFQDMTGSRASGGINDFRGAVLYSSGLPGTEEPKAIIYAAQEFHSLTPEQCAHLVARSFHHSALRVPTPCLWVPRDGYGIAEDQIHDVRTNYPHVLISADGCELDPITSKLRIKRVPPDYDSTANLRL